MSKFQNYLKTFDITSTLTEEDIDKTLACLLYTSDQLIGFVIQIQRHNSLLLTTVETTFTAFRALSIVQILKGSEEACLLYTSYSQGSWS